jgi:anti-anti-sigma regulatory factor
VLVLRGAISDGAEDDLRETLRAVIDEGAAVVVLDLNEVDAISSSARDLVASAGSALSDRGGVLLAWTTNDMAGERSYVMRELRDTANSALFPVERRIERKRP